MRITKWVVAATQSSSGSNDRLLFSDGEPRLGTDSRNSNLTFWAAANAGYL